MGYLDKRAVRRSRKPETSALGLGGPERTGTAVPGVQATVAQAERRQLSWFQGDGEQVGATSLSILARYGWASLHGVRLPASDDATISHVAIGPGGVVVVSEKHWTGSVHVQDGVLRHGGYRCERDTAQLTATCAAVGALLTGDLPVIGVLCVTTRDLPAEPAGGVIVVGRLHLASLLVDLPPRLSPLEVADITRELTRSLLGPSAVPTVAESRESPHHTSALANEASEYFVPRPVPGGPHSVEPAPVHVPVPAARAAAPVVRVATPGWPGGELITPPALPIPRGGERVAPCWPGDEGPMARPVPPTRGTTPGWPSAPDDDWIRKPPPRTVPSSPVTTSSSPLAGG